MTRQLNSHEILAIEEQGGEWTHNGPELFPDFPPLKWVTRPDINDHSAPAHMRGLTIDQAARMEAAAKA